jgi:hypothetical protein
MPRSSQHIDGAGVALAVHLGTFCAVTACLAFALYELMQPIRSANPGLAAYKPPPGTVINLASPAPSASVPQPGLIEPPLETMAASVPQQQSEADKTKTELKTKRPKRQRTARRKERRNPMTGYAFQPYFGGYRSWY